MPRVIGVIQARSDSTRFPGKVLQLLAGRPGLQWVMGASKQVDGLDDVFVATTTEPGDDEVERLAGRIGVRAVRGSVNDVFGRFLQAVEPLNADAIARFTWACPLLDPHIASVVVGAWRALPSLDHVSMLSPRCLPRGLEAQIASVSALHRPAADLSTPELMHHRTHVIRDGRRPQLFEHLQANDIGVQVNYLPVYRHPVYADLGYRPGMCPVAEEYYAQEISLPLFPALTDDDVDRVIALIRGFVGA